MSSIFEFLESVNWDSTGIIISSTSFSKLDRKSKQLLVKVKPCFCRFSHSLSYENVIEEIKQKNSIDLIIGLGGGTALDYAKYIAYNLRINWVAIPSMLSTNVFATNKVAVVDSKGKHTEQGKLPEQVIFDEEYLMKSFQENLYGLVDVFSIHTALADWRIAHIESGLKIDESIVNRAENLLLLALNIADELKNDVYSLRVIASAITESGYITNDYGSGRPESGSEHIFASALELIRPIPHALAVTLGIYIMDYYQKLLFPKVFEKNILKITEIPFLKLKIIDAVNNLKLKWDTVLGVLKSLKPRKDKFTLVNFWADHELDFDQLKEYLEQNKFRFW